MKRHDGRFANHADQVRRAETWREAGDIVGNITTELAIESHVPNPIGVCRMTASVIFSEFREFLRQNIR